MLFATPSAPVVILPKSATTSRKNGEESDVPTPELRTPSIDHLPLSLHLVGYSITLGVEFMMNDDGWPPPSLANEIILAWWRRLLSPYAKRCVRLAQCLILKFMSVPSSKISSPHSLSTLPKHGNSCAIKRRVLTMSMVWRDDSSSFLSIPSTPCYPRVR